MENHYNEYSEFHARETEAHICASFMEMTGMHTTSGKKLNQFAIISYCSFPYHLSIAHIMISIATQCTCACTSIYN